MDFIKKKVRQYQEKKLNEALFKIQFHLDMKKQWSQKADNTIINNEKITAREKILFHEKMINVWEINATKIKKELNKLGD